MEFIIVTGVSGAGKSQAINVLEDLGFYCVDNMPPTLISKFAEICLQSQGKISKIAIVVDCRGGEFFHGVFLELEQLKNVGCDYKILFLDADDAVIMRRFKETRRRHPLVSGIGISVQEAIQNERIVLKPIRERANYIIDTSNISPAQLKERINTLFMYDTKAALLVTCMSFGFKYGIPTESDLVFDVRCLPNPFYIEELKQKTGLDEPVRDYVFKFPQTQGFVSKLFDMIDFLFPLYFGEGKSQLVIAIGCTGGKHRSVALSEALNKHLLEHHICSSVNHRDIKKS